MVYDADAVLPCDIIHGAAELDRQDALRSVIYQQQARRYQSREVRAKGFNIGDMVMRLHPEKHKHKLSPKWDGRS